MGQISDSSLPVHLVPLLGQTASGFAKFFAAWEGLSMESQILLIEEINRRESDHPYEQAIRFKALSSTYPYVRYLAARKIRFDSKGDTNPNPLENRIQQDACDLVRYAPLENGMAFPFLDEGLKNPDAFFRLPHPARLAKMRGLRGCGEMVSNLITHGWEHEAKEHELYEVLLEYLANGQFSSYYERRALGPDGWGEYMRGRDIESLWRLVPKSPGSIAFQLLSHLPESAGLGSGVPQEVLDALSDQQLTVLLSRPDVGLASVRRKLFFDSAETRETLRVAAVSHNFEIKTEEFAEILAKPEMDRRRYLGDLVYALGLRPCMAEAIYDCLDQKPGSETESECDHRYWTQQFVERNLRANLKKIKSRRDWRILELRVYRLARRAASWKRDTEGYLPAEFEPLREQVVQGDPWTTFMHLFPRLQRCCDYDRIHDFETRSKYEKLAKVLPRIEEIDGPEEAETAGPANKDQVEHVASEIKESLSSIQSAYNSRLDGLERALQQARSEQTQALEKKLNQEKADLLEGLKAIENEVVSLRQKMGTLQLLLAVAVGVILWLILRK